MNGSNGSGPQLDPHKQIMVTRDCKRFRKVSSPLAPLASHFVGMLSAETSQGAALRSAFAYAAAGKRDIGRNLSQYDHVTLDVVANMPNVVVVQGNMKTDRLLEETVLDDAASSDSRSVTSSTLSIGVVTPPDLTNTLLLPYTLHQNLTNAVKDRDDAEKTKLSMMALACVVYETAHWISLKTHGYRTDHRKEHVSTDEWSHRSEDVGTIALQAVLGHHLKLVTWADGEQELVSRYIKTVAERAGITGGKAKPLLQPAFVAHIIGGPLPPIKDVTGQPMAGIGDKPGWSGRANLGTIVSIVTPASTCHHVHSSLLGVADK